MIRVFTRDYKGRGAGTKADYPRATWDQFFPRWRAATVSAEEHEAKLKRAARKRAA